MKTCTFSNCTNVIPENGYQRYCEDCREDARREYQRQYYEKNRDRAKEWNASNKARRREYNRKQNQKRKSDRRKGKAPGPAASLPPKRLSQRQAVKDSYNTYALQSLSPNKFADVVDGVLAGEKQLTGGAVSFDVNAVFLRAQTMDRALRVERRDLKSVTGGK